LVLTYLFTVEGLVRLLSLIIGHTPWCW